MLHKLTLTKALKLLRDKKVSIKEIYDDLEQNIESQNKKLNIYLSLLDFRKALKKAHSLSQLPLQGVPIAAKDNFCTTDLPTTASSKILENFYPPYESTATKRLEESGGVIMGKTNLDAWAHGSSTENSDYGRTLNPRNTKFLPGGSSGGSAAAVAADLCLTALGSETAGSIRLPASWCGVVGLKPSYGRVSRHGVIAMASSLDSPGPITKTVEDAAVVLNYIAGFDPADSTSSPVETKDYTKNLKKSIKGFKIGYLYHDLEGTKQAQQKLEKQLKVFEDLGAHVEKVKKAIDPKMAINVYTILQRAEVASNLSKIDGIRYGRDRSYFGREAKNRIILGKYALSSDHESESYQLSQKVRTLFVQDFQRLFQRYDALVSLTSPGYAQEVGASEDSAMFGELADMLAEPSSITGLPGISVPCYRDEKTNLYLGMNIVAPMFQEELVLNLAHVFEEVTDWNSWRKNNQQ